MDPLTQGLLGGLAAQSFPVDRRSPRVGIWQGIVGAFAAMAPDLDVYIQSDSDPTVALLYHRHFTHSLAFIPIGSLITAFVFWLLLGRLYGFKKLYLCSILGYATHGLLDSCTAYGTMLYWPVSHTRISWDLISIIDPIYTSILFFGFMWMLISRRAQIARVFFLLSLFYLTFGYFQQNRVLEIQTELAYRRNHQIERSRAMPTFGNLIVWRSIYEYQDRFYVDGIRVVPFQPPSIWEGVSLEKFSKPNLPENSVLSKGLDIFIWFADDYAFKLSEFENAIGDGRYSSLPQSGKPLWGFQFDRSKLSEPIRRMSFGGDRQESLKALWKMVKENP